jgi:Flp pilus assembly pilin Flp
MAVSLHKGDPEGGMIVAMNQFLAAEEGADLVEYALICGVVAFGCFVAMASLNASLTSFWDGVSTKLSTLLP